MIPSRIYQTTNINLVSVSLVLLCTVVAEVETTNLTCYECYTDDKTSECFTNVSQVNTQNCPSDDYCMVKKIVYLYPAMKYKTTLTRTCIGSCRPGCGVWSEDQSEHEVCRTCCRTDGCNDGNGAVAMKLTVNNRVIGAAIVYTVLLWRRLSEEALFM